MDDKKTVITIECIEDNDGGVNCNIEAVQTNARMMGAAVLALVKSVAEDCGYGSLRETVKDITASLDKMVEVEEGKAEEKVGLGQPKAHKPWEAEIYLQADRNVNVVANIVGELDAVIALILTAVKQIAKTNNMTITEIQKIIDEGLRFLMVQESEVKPTAKDRKTALNASFIKKILFNE